MTRDEYVKSLTIKIEKMNLGINKIEHKVGSMKEKAKETLQGKLQDLHTKREAAVLKVKAVKEAGGDSWHDLKQGTDEVIMSLKDTMTKVLSHFKNQNTEQDNV